MVFVFVFLTMGCISGTFFNFSPVDEGENNRYDNNPIELLSKLRETFIGSLNAG